MRELRGETPKSNIVIHSKELPHTVKTDRKNFYASPEGKKTIKDGLDHQGNVTVDTDDVNRIAHAEGRGPNDEELGSFFDRLENKHSHRALIKKSSRTSSSVSTYVVRNGKSVCINDANKRLGVTRKKIKPAWVR